MNYKFSHSILGGTFDHFHRGHKYFLQQAFKDSEKVTIGLANQNLSKHKLFMSSIEDMNTRRNSLIEFLHKKKYTGRFEIITLNDIYGNSLYEANLDAIYVVEQGVHNAEKINKRRIGLGFLPLKISKIQPIKGVDGKAISSTRIRIGEIDREGYPYINLFENAKKLILPKNLGEELRRPFGKIVKDFDPEIFKVVPFIVAVGDIVVSTLIAKGLMPDISIYDLVNQRKEIVDTEVLDRLPAADVVLKNGQGTIDAKTVLRIYELMKKSIQNNKKIAIEIKGEEDLLTLPVIILSPLESNIVYGIRGVGMIVVVAGEKMKKEMVSSYLSKFVKQI